MYTIYHGNLKTQKSTYTSCQKAIHAKDKHLR